MVSYIEHKKSNTFHRALLIFLLLLIPLQALLSVRWKSATYEEAVHIAAGATQAKTGNMDLIPGYPPLVRMWAALPLLASDVKIPSRGASIYEAYPLYFGTTFLYDYNDADDVLIKSRSMITLLSLLLGIYVYLFSKELFGRNAALIPVFLYAFSPNILAHSRLVTLDLPLTAFCYITFYYFYKVIKAGGLQNIGLAVIFTAFALSTKYIAWFIFPMCACWILALLLRNKRLRTQDESIFLPPVKRAIMVTVLMMGGGLVAINGQYKFNGTFETLRTYYKNLPNHRAVTRSSLLTSLANDSFLSDIPLPFPTAYIRGFDQTLYYDMDNKHPNWYMDTLYKDGGQWWHYYLSLFALKVPVPLLLLLFLLLLEGVVLFKTDPEKRKVAFMVLLPALFFILFFSLVCRSQLGFRLVLPAFPFIFTSVGLLAHYVFREGRVWKVFMGSLFGWFMLASLSIFPHYLSFFNLLAGGPSQGIRYFADSNIDWGQDLKGLGRYVKEKGVKNLRIYYYGPHGDKEPNYYGVTPLEEGKTPSGIFALSATWLYYPCCRNFKKLKPIDKIGHSILIYDLRK